MSAHGSNASDTSAGRTEREIQAIKAKEKSGGFINVYCLAICFVLGDWVVSWSHDLESGLWEYLFAVAIVGAAYFCLALCQSEMTSMLPFSGGTYGFTRVTLGPFPGFLVGCLEVLANWVFVAETVELFGDMVHHMVGGGYELQPLWWLFYYIPAVCVLMSGAKYFWPVCTFFAVLSLLLVLVFVLGSAKEMDTHKYVVEEDNRFFPDGISSFFVILPLTAHQWLGLQAVSLACEDTKDAATTVPKAFLSAVATLFLLSFVIVISVTSQYPGVVEIEHSLVPMNYGYATMFAISEKAATVFSLFSVFAVALSHHWAYSRQLLALARSRLVSKYFRSTLGISDAPNVIILSGSLLGLVALVLVWLGFKVVVYKLLHASIVGAFLVYFAVFASFCIFKYSFSTMPRAFTNPLGYYSAAFGSLVFLLCLIGVLAFEPGSEWVVLDAVIIGVLLTLYYYFVAANMQTYSKEEQSLLLKLYVIKGNAKKRGKNGSKGSKGSKASRSSQGSRGSRSGGSQQGRRQNRSQSDRSGSGSASESEVSGEDSGSELGSASRAPSGDEGEARSAGVAAVRCAAVVSGCEEEISPALPTTEQEPNSPVTGPAIVTASSSGRGSIIANNRVVPDPASGKEHSSKDPQSGKQSVMLSAKLSAKAQQVAAAVYRASAGALDPFSINFQASGGGTINSSSGGDGGGGGHGGGGSDQDAEHSSTEGPSCDLLGSRRNVGMNDICGTIGTRGTSSTSGNT